MTKKREKKKKRGGKIITMGEKRYPSRVKGHKKA